MCKEESQKIENSKRQLAIDFVKAGLLSAKNTSDIFDLVLIVPDNIIPESGHISSQKIQTMLFMKRYSVIIGEKGK